ncbi:MAG: inositol monophosphatase family protein [Myxococcota bacterium]|nr:inositol monophosphatase family protein [Myxococcota bacterium]
MSDLLDFAKTLAVEAGAILKERFSKDVAIQMKGAIDLVTEADHAAEEFLKLRIRESAFGHIPILAEESGSSGAAGQSERWVLDPLDGTVNYAHGIPHFCVLVGYEVRDEEGFWQTIAGATYAPMVDELYWAEKGGGAFLNGDPIGVSSKNCLLDTVLATGFGYDRLFESRDNHAEFCRLNLLTRGVRRFGAAGLDLAYVASGRMDGFWEYELNRWDVSPGLLLLVEAGGAYEFISEPVGVKLGLVASGQSLLPTLREAIESGGKFPPNSREGLLRFLPVEQQNRLRALLDASPGTPG